MSLTPEDIERRTFPIEERGYHRDEVRKYLFQVAAKLRLAMLATAPPRAEPVPAAPADPWQELGTEVAELLRVTQDAVTARRAEAEAISAAIQAGAERDARALLLAAESDAAETRRAAAAEASDRLDNAKVVLTTAQAQADEIIAEADLHARALLTNAREQADHHLRQVEIHARRQAEVILRAERDALSTLHDAKAGVIAAIDALVDADSRPVVDLTTVRPHVHFGELTIAMRDSHPDAAEPVDVVACMVRNAVDQAVAHAGSGAESDSFATDQ